MIWWAEGDAHPTFSWWPSHLELLCQTSLKNPKIAAINKVLQTLKWRETRYQVINKLLILFGCGAVIWAIWRTRNDCCFNARLIDDLSNVIFSCCYWIDAWSIRQTKKGKRLVEQGSRRIRKITSDIYSKAHGWKPVDRRLQWHFAADNTSFASGCIQFVCFW